MVVNIEIPQMKEPMAVLSGESQDTQQLIYLVASDKTVNMIRHRTLLLQLRIILELTGLYIMSAVTNCYDCLGHIVLVD